MILKLSIDIMAIHVKHPKDQTTWQHSVLENMLDGVIVIDEKGTIQSINPACEKIFGYSSDELIGQNVKMLMPNPFHDEHDGYLSNYLNTGKAKIIGIGRQVQGRHKNGSIIHLGLGISEITINDKRMFSGIVRDVSERVKAEKAMESSATRLQSVLENVVDGIITINNKGSIQSFNRAAEHIFGYSADEVMGKNINMLMPSPYREEHDGYLESYHKTGKAHIIGIGREVDGLRKNGSIFPLDLAVSKAVIEGEPLYTGIVRDITDRKQMEKMKNEFISTVSHELRTPLTSIRGSLGLVMADTVGKLPDKVRELLTITSNNTERLLLLINDILDIQKIEAGMMAFHFQSLELNPFLQQAVETNQSYADQYGVNFTFTPTEENIRVYADSDRLMQVMNNLMSNAAKFSPKGESIELSVKRHNGVIRISVSDHGPGIPDDFKGKIFEKFTQYDSTDTRKKGGTGLGLSITRLIVDKHGGEINYTSKLGAGTTFYFELPELISELSTGQLPIPSDHTSQENVLIIEDDPDVGLILKRILAESGFNSDIATTAAEARRRLKEKPEFYNAITLDIILPDQDGLQLLSTLRQHNEIRDIPVVVVSIKASEARREQGNESVGVVDWLNKPINEAKLRQVVMNATGKKSKPQILHVEDDQDIHRLVSKMLQNVCELSWTSTVSAAKDILLEQKFDMVLLDISLPDGSGLDLLEAIKKNVVPPKVVIFSAQNVDPETAQHVNSVLLKSRTTNKELLSTINDTLNITK
ncbi:MAG: PAS domain S-box protein [Gammaproteobacteria bacterium]|nr:PAS domain S-box protein [Gammaproteobacteria bacterium]